MRPVTNPASSQGDNEIKNSTGFVTDRVNGERLMSINGVKISISGSPVRVINKLCI